MPVVDNIIGIVRGINDRKKASRVDDALGNYLDDPDAAIQAVMPHDPRVGIGLDANLQSQRQAQAKAKREAGTADTATLNRFLRGVDPAQAPAAIDELAPYLTEAMGMTPEALGRFRSAVEANPSMLSNMDDETWKAIAADKHTTRMGSPGTQFFKDGEVVHSVPYARKVEDTSPGTLSRVFDPNTGQYVDSADPSPAGGAASAPGSFDAESLRPHFIAQESNGDYTAVNSETGALGAYQVMPQTGQNLAKRVGVAWRPDLMRSNTPEARKYQDAIGSAAIQEAVDNSGGDPATAFSYYYGGSDRDKWGPRTQQYTQEMMQRLGGEQGGGGSTQQGSATATSTYSPPKPTKPNVTYRNATPEEVTGAGYPTGTAAQIGSDGKLTNIRIPKNAEAAEAGTEAKGRMTGILADMAHTYAALQRGGGIVDTDRGTGHNIGAYLESSTLGQLGGRVVGSENQQMRQSIKNSQPLLLQEIRKATEMGVRGMDSNKELDFYLQAASDPGKDLISNLTALQVLDNVYGEGTALKQALPPELYERVVARSYSMMKDRNTKVGGAIPRPGAQGGQQGGQQGGTAPVGTIIRMPDGSRQRKTASGWEAM
jgi:hypothetical protein